MIGFTAALRLTSLVSSLFLTQNISFFHQPLLRKRSVTVSGSARNNAWPCSLPPVLPIPGMLSLDWDLWPFFWDLGIFGKLWRCVKWNISVYFASHIWFYFSHLSFALRFFYAAVHYHSFRDFGTVLGIFILGVALICESPVCLFPRKKRIIQDRPNGVCSVASG